MSLLFDTDAVSEVLKPHPAPDYLRWLATIPREDQFTSAVVIGELFKGAYRSSHTERHLSNIEARVLPAVSVLPYDTEVARLWGRLQASLESKGRVLADADLQIAATALRHGLALVTGNLRHFERVPGLRIETALANTRPQRRR